MEDEKCVTWHIVTTSPKRTCTTVTLARWQGNDRWEPIDNQAMMCQGTWANRRVPHGIEFEAGHDMVVKYLGCTGWCHVANLMAHRYLAKWRYRDDNHGEIATLVW